MPDHSKGLPSHQDPAVLIPPWPFPIFSSSNPVLEASAFHKTLPFYINIYETDRSYKERLMALNISRGLSPAISMSGAKEKRQTQQHLIMLVGLTASGKSTLAKAIVQVFRGYVLVSEASEGDDNKDNWETEWEKCVFAARSALSSGMNVISDLPNETPEKRRKWIRLAEEYGATIDAIVLDTSINTCHQRISNIYKTLFGDSAIAVEKSQPHHHRLRCVAARYSKPASSEFAGRVIYLPEGVQSSGYWSSEKLKRFLPDVVAQFPPVIFKSPSTVQNMAEGGLISGSSGVAVNLEESSVSVSSLKFAVQQNRSLSRSLLTTNLRTLPPINTSQELPLRRDSPNAIAIRASPRRRKRTHERKPTIAISVAELATKASPPLTANDAHEEACLESKEEGSMNELILECPTSPLRTQDEMDARRAFVPVTDGGSSRELSGQRISKFLNFSPSPTSPFVCNDTNGASYCKITTLSLSAKNLYSDEGTRPTEGMQENSAWKQSTVFTPHEGIDFTLHGIPTMTGFTASTATAIANQRFSGTTAPPPPISQSSANTKDERAGYEEFVAHFSSRGRYANTNDCASNGKEIHIDSISKAYEMAKASKIQCTITHTMRAEEIESIASGDSVPEAAFLPLKQAWPIGLSSQRMGDCSAVRTLGDTPNDGQ